jgi:hypothetical protein
MVVYNYHMILINNLADIKIYIIIMSKKYVFNDLDYNSGDGMMTSIWGPPLWHVLHITSFNYPNNPTNEQKKHYFDFYNNLKNILPCRYCRENLVNNLITLPLTMNIFKNRYTLSKYVYDLHEIINDMLGKKSGLSYNDIRDRYEHFRSRCLDNPSKIRDSINVETTEKGCTEPLYGVKSKCVLNIVPKDDRLSSFKMDPKCILKKGAIKCSKKDSAKKGSAKKGSAKKGSAKKGSAKKGSAK